MFPVDLTNVPIMGFGGYVDSCYAVLDHVDETCGDVAALAFGLEDYAAAMCRTGIGTEHAEEIREIRHRQPEVGGWVIICPGVPQVLAVASTDVKARRHFRHFEAGRNHDDVGGPQFAVRRNDAIAGEMVDLVSDQLDVRLCESFEPSVVEQNALAIRRIGGHAFFDQI